MIWCFVEFLLAILYSTLLEMEPPRRERSSALVALLILVTTVGVCNAGNNLSSSETTMVDIFKEWNKSNSYVSSVLDWSLATYPCNWTGVYCDMSSNVDELMLARLSSSYGYNNTFSLLGELPATLKDLTFVSYLYLTGKLFNGTLDVIGEIPTTSLQELDLSNNFLTGPVPFKYSTFNTTIKGLSLGSNQLNGSLDFLLEMQLNLWTIDLSHNHFSGEIPLFSPNTSFDTIDFSHNQLSGSIPVESGLLSSQLQHLDLSNNQLSGPVDFSRLSTTASLLSYLDLSNNLLNGTVNFNGFSGMSYAHSYETLNLSYNFFDNMIPMSSGALNYTTIDLSNNKFNNFTISGNFLQTLTLLCMRNNSLRGEFPSSVLDCPSLQNLYFDYNKITSISFPIVPFQGFIMSTISLVGNDISTVNYAKSGPFSESWIGSQNILFLGGNPYCTKIDSNLKTIVCRFNKTSPTLPIYKQSQNILEIVLSTIASFLFLVIMTFAVIIRRLYIKNLSYRKLEQELSKQEVKPKMYSYNELRVATREFHHDNKLGEGGFGVVYKGILSDNTHVAVKQLIKSKLVLIDFLNEVVIISGVRHRNLIKLKGCCLSGDQRILVYEYAENRNLAQALWDCPSENKLELDWSTRLRIIIGIARGLTYLHEEVQPPIIHRDIKAPNILLDKDLNPKVADFGLALFVPELDNEQTHFTGTVIGTRGYLSPEYASFGHISTSIDTFSFGVVILEIISGRKNIDFEKPQGQHILLQWAWSMYETNELWHLIDPKLVHEPTNTEIIDVIKIGLSCVQYMPANRPKMSDIVSMLSNRIEMEDVCMMGKSEPKFGSFHSNFTTSTSYYGQERDISMATLA